MTYEEWKSMRYIGGPAYGLVDRFEREVLGTDCERNENGPCGKENHDRFVEFLKGIPL